jgi:hypothetical protein
MSDASFASPSIPVHLADYPTMGGLVVPFITMRHRNGKAALGLVDASRLELCLRDRLCGVCGKKMRSKMVFLMRRIDLRRKCSNEAGLCPPCAAYTQTACPMIAGNMVHYRASMSAFVGRRCGDSACPCVAGMLPEKQSARLGAPADAWYALWTMRYQLVQDDTGRLAAGFAGLRVLALREIRPQAQG